MNFIAMVMKTYNYSLVKAALHKYAGLQNKAYVSVNSASWSSVLMPEFSLKIGFNLWYPMTKWVFPWELFEETTFGYVIGLDFKDLKGAERYVLQIKLSYW